jgi:hypothetical protein
MIPTIPKNLISFCEVCSAICGIAELFNRKTYCQRSAPQNLIGHHLLALDRKESSLVVFTLCRLALMDRCCKATRLKQEEIMRFTTLAIVAILAIGLGSAASAAKQKAPAPTVGSFEKCEQLAIERGVPHGQTGHSEFVQQCMGQRPKGRTTG